MDKNDHLMRHLELCERIYRRLLAEGKWPWPDSPNPDDVIESEDCPDDL